MKVRKGSAEEVIFALNPADLIGNRQGGERVSEWPSGGGSSVCVERLQEGKNGVCSGSRNISVAGLYQGSKRNGQDREGPSKGYLRF